MRWSGLIGRRVLLTVDGGDMAGVLGRVASVDRRDGLIEVVDAESDGRPVDGRAVVPTSRVTVVQVLD